MLLVYDVTDVNSYTEVSGFLQEANRFNEKGLKFLLACKSDLEAAVDENEAKEFAENEAMDGFFSISNKTGEGVR
jgi:hypothetical protein